MKVTALPTRQCPGQKDLIRGKETQGGQAPFLEGFGIGVEYFTLGVVWGKKGDLVERGVRVLGVQTEIKPAILSAIDGPGRGLVDFFTPLYNAEIREAEMMGEDY